MAPRPSMKVNKKQCFARHDPQDSVLKMMQRSAEAMIGTPSAATDSSSAQTPESPHEEPQPKKA